MSQPARKRTARGSYTLITSAQSAHGPFPMIDSSSVCGSPKFFEVLVMCARRPTAPAVDHALLMAVAAMDERAIDLTNQDTEC
jgi:hypothetical protein